MKPYVLCQRNVTVETIEITSSNMLEELLDRLTILAKDDDMRFTAQIILNDDSGILITVGSEISHLEFYSASQRPPIVPSIGQWNIGEDEIVIALHGGVPSTVQKNSCVPIEHARDAVRQY